MDNAHGAYLHFLEKPLHPLDLGADLCCDSAHKTLPVLTGGAYLHLSRGVPEELRREAKQALALFGSTSPSYLTLCSLDGCNAYLAGPFRQDLAEWTALLGKSRQTLRQNGWQAEESDPLRLTLRAPEKMTGVMLSQRLREAGMECEYADGEHLVMMLTPQNRPEELRRLIETLGRNERPPKPAEKLLLPKAKQEMSIREAMLRPQERIPAEKALGRICGSPTVACPPGDPYRRIRRANRPGSGGAVSALRRGKRGGRERGKMRRARLQNPRRCDKIGTVPGTAPGPKERFRFVFSERELLPG